MYPITYQNLPIFISDKSAQRSRNRRLLVATLMTAGTWLGCSETHKKTPTDSRDQQTALGLTDTAMPQGSLLVGTAWRHCSYVYTAKAPTGDSTIFELTKITFATSNSIKMVGEGYASDDQCQKKLTQDEVVKIAGPDYSPEFFKPSDQAFTYRIAQEANPSGTHDFDVTDDTGYQLYTEVRMKENKFQLSYACLSEDNIKAGDCVAIDGDSPARRARNFKNEELVISWTKWE